MDTVCSPTAARLRPRVNEHVARHRRPLRPGKAEKQREQRTFVCMKALNPTPRQVNRAKLREDEGRCVWAARPRAHLFSRRVPAAFLRYCDRYISDPFRASLPRGRRRDPCQSQPRSLGASGLATLRVRSPQGAQTEGNVCGAQAAHPGFLRTSQNPVVSWTYSSFFPAQRSSRSCARGASRRREVEEKLGAEWKPPALSSHGAV